MREKRDSAPGNVENVTGFLRFLHKHKNGSLRRLRMLAAATTVEPASAMEPTTTMRYRSSVETANRPVSSQS